MLTKGDFHIHSTASDGDLSPTELIFYAKKRGIDTIAITDHNSTDGIAEAAEIGMKHGVSVIPGVELSTRYKGESIHMLGYFRNMSFYQSIFQEILKLIGSHRFKEAKNLLKNIVPIEPFGSTVSVIDGITFLKTFDASVVLAHPVRINRGIFHELLAFPFDGIEAKYCCNTAADTDFFIKEALLHFSFYTAGSDFHTHKNDHQKHCLVGQPLLDELEIQTFLRNSGALIIK